LKRSLVCFLYKVSPVGVGPDCVEVDFVPS
jgi:hypothetical protein